MVGVMDNPFRTPKGQHAFTFAKKNKLSADNESDTNSWQFNSMPQPSTPATTSLSSVSANPDGYQGANVIMTTKQKWKRIFVDSCKSEFEWVRCINNVMFWGLCRKFPALFDQTCTLVEGIHGDQCHETFVYQATSTAHFTGRHRLKQTALTTNHHGGSAKRQCRTFVNCRERR